jgi:hypothetical protein
LLEGAALLGLEDDETGKFADQFVSRDRQRVEDSSTAGMLETPLARAPEWLRGGTA